jgi:aspartyl-tRNA(Asn)/glutamyl-tRNA(Gln) amidotransferase subunit C
MIGPKVGIIAPMAKVTEKEVEQIATLARLKLTRAENQEFQEELSGILGYIDTINEVNTDGVAPTAQVTGLSSVVREDVKNPSALSRDEVLSNAPDVKDGYIKVKSVLD